MAKVEKKVCNHCSKRMNLTLFYKSDSEKFEDGHIDICKKCVMTKVDENDLETVVDFLRHIDKPLMKNYWNEAVNSDKYTIGEYVRKLNSIVQLKNKKFNDSDALKMLENEIVYDDDNEPMMKKKKTENPKGNHFIETEGGVIEYSNELVDKWGTGYTPEEYLQLEKFYIDMSMTHQIITAIHKMQLKQIAYMTIDLDRLRRQNDWGNYAKLSKTMEDTTKSAGFRPVDRQSAEEASGIRSFSQVWEEVEKRGFRKPTPELLNRDIYDGMIVSLLNYYHGLVGKSLITDIPEEVAEELEKFYEIDLDPDELDDNEAYENLDFSTGEEDDDDDD